MCTMGECNKSMGQWVQFRTRWGSHRGVVEAVNDRAVLMRVPRQYAPMGLVSHEQSSEEQRLDIALAEWGGYGGYRGRWGYPGYGAWRAGYWWWWLAFASIFLLALLW